MGAQMLLMNSEAIVQSDHLKENVKTVAGLRQRCKTLEEDNAAQGTEVVINLSSPIRTCVS